MQIAKFNVRRGSNDEMTFASITAEVESDALTSEGAFRNALTHAVTEWVNTTEDGKDAWKQSKHDLNIGDLSNINLYTSECTLGILLVNRKIHNLKIEVFSASDFCLNWMYDTVLASPSEE